MTTRTAAQRRQDARVTYNAFFAACPTRQLLDALSNKWVCLILTALEDGPKRHSDLLRVIAGVSQKMLTQTLRGLERDGIITRKLTLAVPVRVDYELTALGASLTPVVHAVKTWAETHMDEVLRARQRYDREAC
jgi:DNA-binding HxlR family transcriptional regulator